jgi:signal transduction histidine kinase
MADPTPPTTALPGPVSRLIKRAIALPESLVPEELLTDPETARRARLMTQFGILGSFFGLIYALFYLFIGHRWGAEIIVVCTVGVVVSPFLMRWKHSIGPAANFFCLILTLGFLGLCFVEGGAHGHAIAWLVSVPLCALILAGTKPAIKWVIISFLAASLVVGLDLAGVNLPITYDSRWNSVVSAAGYLGLILFMCLLGLIFERGRANAFAGMQTALGRLAASNEKLVYLNKEKNEFMGIAAHDLKNPLTVILSNGELLREIAEEKPAQELAEMIISASERMHHLITNLLDANAIEEGKFASKLDCYNIGALVELSVTHNRSSATRKRIEIRTGLGEEVFVRADRMATMQILDNLISNAVKYSPFDSTVQVHLLCEREYALIRVRDEGPGISEADQKKLFQKFSRLSASPTGGESSTGLGLSIAKKLAEAMAGSIECHSMLGYGAIFTLRLPLWSEVSKAQAGENAGKTVATSTTLPEGVPSFTYQRHHLEG